MKKRPLQWLQQSVLALFCLGAVYSVQAFDIVKPDEERELIENADIHSLSMNVGLYLGLINYENFNSDYLLGFYVSYPFDEDIFVDVEFGISAISDAEFRNIGLPLFNKKKTDVSFYSVLIGYNLLPGEVYWSQQKTMISRLYLLAGVGNTNINSDNSITLHLGAGFKLELDDDHSLRLEARDRIIDTDILGTDQLTNNIEFHFAYAWNF